MVKVIFDPILGRLRSGCDNGDTPTPTPTPTPTMNDFTDDFDPTDFY